MNRIFFISETGMRSADRRPPGRCRPGENSEIMQKLAWLQTYTQGGTCHLQIGRAVVSLLLGGRSRPVTNVTLGWHELPGGTVSDEESGLFSGLLDKIVWYPRG